MSSNHFIRPDDSYKRNIDPIKNYIDQAAHYLSIEHNKPIDQCIEFVKSTIKRQDLGISNPTVKYIGRDDNGDKDSRQIPLYSYIKDVINNGDILAPSFTVYDHPTVKESILSKFIEGNVKRRSKAKKEAFKARAAGKTELFIAKNNEQGIMKIYNNSLSGAFASNGTSLFNPTAHSTLTSTTRNVSSLGNVINEKVIMGNRHYWSYDIALNNLVFITKYADLEAIGRLITKYNLYIPTSQDVMDCINYSTKFYYINSLYEERLFKFINKLSGLQKAAFLYVGDLYHIKET